MQIFTSHTLFRCAFCIYFILISSIFPLFVLFRPFLWNFSPFHISLPSITILRYSLEGGGHRYFSVFLPLLLSLNHFSPVTSVGDMSGHQQNRVCFLSKREILSSLVTQGREFWPVGSVNETSIFISESITEKRRKWAAARKWEHFYSDQQWK